MESNIALVKDIIDLTERYDRIAREKNLPERPIPKFDNLDSLNTTLLKKCKVSMIAALQNITEAPANSST